MIVGVIVGILLFTGFYLFRAKEPQECPEPPKVEDWTDLCEFAWNEEVVVVTIRNRCEAIGDYPRDIRTEL